MGNEQANSGAPISVTGSQLDAVAQQIAAASTVAILPHQNADGDALGAAVALGLGLTSRLPPMMWR